MGKKGLHHGFSIVEMMVVVAILAIFATIATPRFQAFQAKARIAEGRSTLAHLHTLQEAFKATNDQFAAFGSYGENQCVPPAGAAALGFELAPCNAQVPRYVYEVQVPSQDRFVSTATSGAGNQNKVCPGEPSHSLTSDDQKNLVGPTSCQ